MRAGLRALPAWALTALLALAYVIAAPPSSDLAAASYRSALFAGQGLTLWDNSWYGGHHLLAYSLLAPALGALLGPQLLAALAMVAVAALFTALLGACGRPPGSRPAALWLAWGAAVSLLSNRVPFDLGLAIGLGSLLAAVRGARAPALALALLCSLASPVAGAFLALALLARALAGPRRRADAGLMLAALAPIALLAVVFPERGTQPFAASAFFPALAGVAAVVALLPRRWRALRIGAALYAAVLVGSYVLHTPVGGNAERLGALFAGPLAALAAGAEPGARSSPRRLALLVLALPLLYWQANAPVSDFAAAASDPGTAAAYYRPLLGELRALGIGYGARPARIEVVPLSDHYEARWTAPAVMLARGWERQLDTLHNALFYDGATLTPARYRAWLLAQGVSYVALPDATPDYSAVAEARLLRGGRAGAPLPYLRTVWSSPHWRLFAVLGAAALAQPPSTLGAVTHDSFALTTPRPGAYTVLLRFTPYWAAGTRGACVERAPGDWTRVRTPRAGTVRVSIAFSLGRVLSRGPRCA